MAPPKVTLASKTPVEEPVVSETLPEEKKDKLDVAAINVCVPEAGSRFIRARQARQQRHRVMCGIAVIIIVVIAILGTMALVHRLKRHHHRRRMECRYGKNKLPEHVKVDHDNHLIYAKHDHDRMEETPALHLLHEYDRRLIAYKDEDKNICYIDRLDETFEDGYARWLTYERHGRSSGKMLAQVSPVPIQKEVLMHVGDIHIYAHCENATSFWFMEIHERTEQKAVIVTM
ncbi:hypothetical protein PoB_006861100 [Plakobranchus ocellatus]|uniref:Uncharacterized protein n=1 Tax=Plakobranchus ocellatus TaxID=259542 RepID=A0AAV4DE25_9GAST|nr:hypothetical protein PoB_006861100 [Plakobranchus ocellatus]